jgi:hypothetical protein
VNPRIKIALATAVTATMVIAVTTAFAGDGGGPKNLRAWLSGYQEVPAVSTTSSGTFEAALKPGHTEIAYSLHYSALEGDVQQAHIHLGQPGVNGGISVFLCSNLGNGPAGTQPCPAGPATVTGTLTAADVVGPAAQGIATGEFEELLRAIKSRVTYVNVHSSKFPGGEIRSQLRGHGRGGGGGPKH